MIILSLLLIIIFIPSVILICNFMDVPVEVYLIYVLWIVAAIIFMGSLRSTVITIFSPID